MRYEIVETANIRTVEEVENRIYHSFKVTRTLPDPGPRKYISPFGLWIPQEYPSDEVDPLPLKERFISPDYRLAEEVAIEWWAKIPVDHDDKCLIAYRCGGPVRLNGKTYEWSGVRRWKDVACSFHCHRNTAKNRWNNAMKEIFAYVQSLNCA